MLFLLALLSLPTVLRAQVKIMPLGNSITQGNTQHNSYRRALWFKLRNGGYAVDFVGSQNGNLGGPPPNPDFDLNSEGHWGWRADELLGSISGWAATYQPDIVLLHAGSNDMLQGQSVESTLGEIGQLIDRLRAANPNVKILLGQLIPTTLAANGNITALNNALPALAAQKSTAQSSVTIVDQNTGFNAAADTFDGVHPTEGGEEKMAAKWYQALQPLLAAASPPAAAALRAPENPANTTAGLTYSYYEGSWTQLPDFNSLSAAKTGTTDLPTLALRNRDDYFGFRYTGFVDVPADGEYTFYTSSDDGSQLFIGSTLVVDNNGAHGTQERAGKIGLQKGKHAFTLTFFENTGDQVLTASYAGPGLAKTQLPAAALYRIATTESASPALRTPENPANTTAGLDYQYYEGNWTELPNFSALAPVKAGASATITLSARNRDDYFGFRYTGFVDVPADGEYTFYTSSDDGSQLFIGSTLVVDNNGAHGTQERAGKIGLQKGKHAFTLTFFENTGDQVLTASYAGPGLAKTQLPAAALYRIATTSGFITTAGSFYRAINLNGPALTLDGNAWESRTAANFYYSGNAYENQGVPLAPATDADRARMIRSFIWGGAPSVTLSAVPSGTYDVYAYVWEDNNSETFSIRLDNNLVLSNYQSGSAGTWQKLGPWRTTSTNGTLTLSTQGGVANLSGLEVWRASGSASAAQADAGSLAQEAKLSLYPNPSSTQVYLGADDWSQVVVRDSYGRVRLTQDQRKANTPLDTSALPNGIYSVEARSATGRTLRSSLVVAH